MHDLFRNNEEEIISVKLNILTQWREAALQRCSYKNVF